MISDSIKTSAISFPDKPGKSLYLPISVEEAYKRLIASYELAARKEPAYKVRLDGIRQEFLTLNPARLHWLS